MRHGERRAFLPEAGRRSGRRCSTLSLFTAAVRVKILAASSALAGLPTTPSGERTLAHARYAYAWLVEGDWRTARATLAGVAVSLGGAYLNTGGFRFLDEAARAEVTRWSEALGVRVPALTGSRGIVGLSLMGAAFGLGYSRLGRVLRMSAPVAGAAYGVGFWWFFQALGWAATTEVPRRRPSAAGGWSCALEGLVLGLLTDGLRRPPV